MNSFKVPKEFEDNPYLYLKEKMNFHNLKREKTIKLLIQVINLKKNYEKNIIR